MKKNNKVKIIMLLSLLLMLMIQTTMALIITEPQSVKNTFKPFKYAMNDLIVSKKVEHSYGESYKVPNDLSFDFNINLGDEYANYTFETTQGEKTTNELGVMSVSLKPGETIHIEDIEEGTKVTVTEIQNKPGFTIKDVSVTKDGTISSDETLIVDYTNVYKATPAKTTNISLNGIKILEGREWQEGDTFAFTLEYQSTSGEWLPLATKTITYNPENTEYNKFSFDEELQLLEFTKLGAQSFRITEVEGNLENIDYDKTINYFNIVTSDNKMDGQIDIEEVNGYQNITVTEKDGLYNLDVIFNNTFVKALIEDLNIKLNVIKTINNIGDYELSPEGFEFILLNLDTNEETKLKTDTNGNLIYDLTYNENDIGKTFNYVIKEVNDGREYVTYSDKEYNISIKVDLNENNELYSTILVNDKKTTDLTFAFENTYDKKDPVIIPEDITLDFNIENIINNTGDKEIGPENFEFILENIDTNEKETTLSDSNGNAKFEMTYTAEDIGKTFIYEITQICKQVKGLTCSNKKYTIEVTIELGEDNNLIANTKVNEKEVTDVNVRFENTYHVINIEDIKLDVNIENIVNNTGDFKIGPENFEFILENIDNNEKETTLSDSNGNAKFEITYTEEDIGKTFIYEVTQTCKQVEGLICSDKKYTIEVTIELSKDNKLIAKTKLNDKKVTELNLVFENTYHVAIIDDIKLDLLIKNIVKNTGKYSLGPENFTIILINSDNGKTMTSVTDSNGNASFPLIFTKDDIGKTFNYELSLVAGHINGMTYDDTIYDIQITISLNDNDELVATTRVNGVIVDNILVEFINTYYIAPETPALPPTVDTTDNTPYIRTMVITGGCLIFLALLQHMMNLKQSYLTNTQDTITNIVPETDYGKVELVKTIIEETTSDKKIKKTTRKKKVISDISSDDLFDQIMSKKRNRKTTKK